MVKARVSGFLSLLESHASLWHYLNTLLDKIIIYYLNIFIL
jgi:hypothetical protein